MVSVEPDGSAGPAASKRESHQAPGVLHLAVSLQIVDPDGGWLLQRRARSKALFADRWANTCCTHPAPGESPAGAAVRRVREELGLVVGQLTPAGAFTYRAVDAQSGLVEHELDHVFVAVAGTGSAVASAAEISELVRLPFSAAMELVMSDSGAPWAAEVLRRAAAALV